MKALEGRLSLMRPLAVVLFLLPVPAAQTAAEDRPEAKVLSYHPLRVSPADHSVLPWYSADLGESYDHVIGLTWKFWRTMRIDRNGLPYPMNHQVWRGDFDDRRGIGGDQFAMALSSFALLYPYSGDESVKEEMKFIADYYLAQASRRRAPPGRGCLIPTTRWSTRGSTTGTWCSGPGTRNLTRRGRSPWSWSSSTR